MIMVTLVMAGVIFYTWRRAREHKRENARRTAAEKEVLSLARLLRAVREGALTLVAPVPRARRAR